MKLLIEKLFLIPNLLIQSTLDEFGCNPHLIGKYRNEEFVLRIYTYGFEFQSAKGYVFLGKNIERKWGEKFIYDLEYSEWKRYDLDSDHILTLIELECDCY